MRALLMAAAAATLLLTASLAAQTSAEILQRAIYLEDAVGDVDGAVMLYRQLQRAAAPGSEIARATERRLAVALAKTRGTPVGVLSRRESGSPREPLATVQNGRYRHTWTGIEFTLPADWQANPTGPSSDDGEQVLLIHVPTRRTLSVWMIKEDTPPHLVPTRLEGAPIEKVAQRRGDYGSLSDYRIRPENVLPVWVGNRQGVSAIGEYRDPERLTLDVRRDGSGVVVAAEGSVGLLTGAPPQPPVEMREYMTWIYTDHTRAFFFGKVPAAELDEFRIQVDPIIQSAVVP